VNAEGTVTQVPRPTPVSVITGFLGSGKTTLLRSLLRDPALGRTAVIINEFGEIGIDHDLVEASDEDFIELTTGCLCCKVRSDLVMTLRDLARRRSESTLPPFERVLIETSGLADPAAILQALMIDRDLAGIYCLGEVVTTVDSLLGLATLEQHAQSARQVAVADRIVLTKSDLSGTIDGRLADRIGAINPGAAVLPVVHGRIAARELLGDAGSASVSRWVEKRYLPVDSAAHAGLHDARIGSWCLVREQPIRAVALALFLEALIEHCGGRLLRVKGIVHVAEEPLRPAVIHGVQHVFHPPEWLDRWPSDDRRSRIVFIGEAIPVRWIEALLDVLDADVAAEQQRLGARQV
jgi:G3E family GTPase